VLGIVMIAVCDGGLLYLGMGGKPLFGRESRR
jgi:hypothetical protein